MPATPTAPRGCTNFKLRQLAHRVDRRYAAEMGPACGLTTAQYGLLGQIDAFGPLRAADLAARLGLDPSTLTRNLQALVDAGWVASAPGPDRRSRLLSLTESGRARRVEAQRAWKRAQLALNARLGEARVARLHALLDECQQLLKEDEAA
jgi:DNA-binding MarR family transcriptional regulator